MSVVKELQAALEIWGAIFVLMAMPSLLGGRTNKVGVKLAHLMLCNGINLAADALALIFSGEPGLDGYFMIRVTNFIVFAAVPVMTVLFADYLCALAARTSRTKPRKLLWWISWLAALHLLLIIVNHFNGMIYYFDADNLYHRSWGYSVIASLAGFEIIMLVALVIRIRKHLRKNEIIAILVYMALPFLSNILQTFLYGLSMNNIALTMALMMLYYTHEMGKTRRLNASQQELMQHKLQLAEQAKDIAEKEQALTMQQVRLSMSQIRPHFMFNALGSIEQLCKLNPAKAAEATHYFTVYLRKNLTALSSTEPVPVENEMEQVRAYIWLEKMRFGEDVNYVEEIDAAGFGVPSLSIQPLVENAVKHGMMGTEEGQITIRVIIREFSDCFKITVSDNGCGFDTAKLQEEPEKHVGLKNVRERIEMMVGGSLELRSYVGAGTEVTVTIPKEKKEKA